MEINRIKVKKILDHYGSRHQELKAIEEMAELTQTLIKFRDNPVSIENAQNVYEELADVMIMVEQLKLIYFDDDLLEKIVDAKLERQLRRIEDEANRRIK